MLKIANLYPDKLHLKYWDVISEEKYKWCNNTYINKLNIPDNNEHTHAFISINKDNDVIGYICYDIFRSIKYVRNLNIISFAMSALDKIIFSNDIRKCIQDIFEVHKYKYLCFNCAEENPSLINYRRLVGNLNGRIVGYEENSFESTHGDICNRILFEITAENYFKESQKIS